MPPTTTFRPDAEQLESARTKIRSVDPGTHEQTPPEPLTQTEAAALNLETRTVLQQLQKLDSGLQSESAEKGQGDIIPWVRGNPDSLRDWNVTYPAKINRTMRSKEPTGTFANGKPRYLWIRPQSVFAKFIGGAGESGLVANPNQNAGKSIAIFSCTVMDPTEPERPLLDQMLRDRPATFLECRLVMKFFEDA